MFFVKYDAYNSSFFCLFFQYLFFLSKMKTAHRKLQRGRGGRPPSVHLKLNKNNAQRKVKKKCKIMYKTFIFDVFCCFQFLFLFFYFKILGKLSWTRLTPSRPISKTGLRAPIWRSSACKVKPSQNQ